MEISHASGDRCIVKFPSLSNIHFMDDYLVPSALKIKLNFSNGIINNIIIEQLLVENKIFAINSAKIDLTKGKKFSNSDEVKLEEKKKILVP